MNDISYQTENSPQRLARGDGHDIAYHCTRGESPGVIFLGGFRSDMTGTKATALERACRDANRAFIRFDYFGHGASSGDFRAGTIGRWFDDAVAVLDRLTTGPQLLVGSSMGGWIMLLLARARPERVAGMVGIAAAPDFTQDLMWDTFDETIRATLVADGVYFEPSPYDPEPTPITHTLIIEGRNHLVLRQPIPFAGPVRLIHGIDDPDVPWQHALKTADALTSRDVVVTLIKGGDHRLSEPAQINRILRTVEETCALAV